MLFWDLIRDFFVNYIFGGTNSNGDYINTLVGQLSFSENGVVDDVFNASTVDITWFVGKNLPYDVYINMGDWLSTTATIISMVGICIGLFLFIKWLFKVGAGFIRLR